MKHQHFTTLKKIALALILTISASQSFAQTTNGIFFQAVARDNFSNPAKDRKIFVQTSIIQTSTTGTKVLTEEHQATTDATGVFSISIGNGTRVGGTAANLAGIDWSKGPFYLNLKVAITPVGSTSNWDYTKEWVDMGTTSFGAVPFAYYAANVAGFDTKLNIADSTKGYVTPTKLAAKTFDQTPLLNSIATKLNIADSTTKYITPTQLAGYNFSSGGKTTDTTSLSNRINLKADAVDVTNSLNLKANASDVTSALNLKANTSDLTSGLALKLDASKLGVANGVATLNTSGIIPSSQLPPVLLSSTSVVASDADMMALSSATVGSIAIRTDVNKNYVLSALPASTLGNWIELLTPAAPVQTVNGYTGSVNLSKSDLNLGNVDNTSDATKQVSNPTQAALNLKLDANKVGVANGTASLNALGKIPTDQIPAISFSSVKVLGSQADMLTLSGAVVGSVVIRTDVNKNFVLSALPASTIGNWIELLTPAPPVQTVNGYTGNVSLVKSDIALGNVENTSDADKIISTRTQTALDLKANTADMTTALALKAPLASPTFTGTVTTGIINTGALSATSVTAPTYASAPKQLTYSGSAINWNPVQGLNAYITLTQNSSLSFTAAPPVGSYGTVVLTQDNTGSRTLSLPTITNVTNKVLGSTSTTTVTLSTASNSKDILNFYYDGTICYWNIGQGYGAASSTNSGPTNLATGVTGTLAVANGGTGATSANAAFNALAPTQTSNSGKYLTTDGTNTSWGTVASTLPTTVNTNSNYNIVMATGSNAALVTGTGNGGNAATLNPYTGKMSVSGLTAYGYGITSPIYASTPQVLTDASTISWDPINGLNASVTLAGNRTLNFTNTLLAGSYGTLVVTQDATGGRTLTLPSTANKVLGSTSTTTIGLSSAAGAKDILNFYYDGTNCFWNIGQGYGTASTSGNTNLVTGVTGTLTVANGGTGATTLTGYIKGSGTATMTASSTIPVADVTGAAPLASPTFTGIPAAPTATAGTNTTQVATTAFVTSAVASAVRLNSDEFTATTGQTSFTFTTSSSNTGVVQTPTSKPFMYINGTRIKNSAFTWTSGTSVTYIPANNNSYALVAGDRVQFDYAY